MGAVNRSRTKKRKMPLVYYQKWQKEFKKLDYIEWQHDRNWLNLYINNWRKHHKLPMIRKW